jgi:Asp-tRNA(Asn)/Glu-tRNA(Gln) amidotransferase A subunit family amidase
VIDAWDIAGRVRSRTVRAVDVVDEALARARTDSCNAFTVLTDEDARRHAAEVDAGTRGGPLAGVPVTVKDHVWLAGQRATNGSRALAEFVPSRSAACVERLIDAGAVVIGKTNNPEFCYRGTTENELFGATRNPRAPSRTAGGSSGGAAASVAAGIVPLAVGTDGGGSIRIPSAFCGVYGHKPSFGLVPKMPGFRGWPTLSVTGPIAASVRDLALALSVMAGPHPADWLSFPGPAGSYVDAVGYPRWDGLRVAVSEDLGFAALDPDVRTAFRAAVSAAADAGAQIVDAVPPARDPLPLWDAIALPEGYASEGPLVEDSRELVGDDAAAITLAGRDRSARDYLDAQAARSAYAEQWGRFFAEVDVLLAPALPTTAFPLGRIGPATIDGKPVPDGFDAWCALALPANLAGLPATCVPIGTGRDGLPVAAQVLGARWGDATVLRAAALLDAALPDVKSRRRGAADDGR